MAPARFKLASRLPHKLPGQTRPQERDGQNVQAAASVELCRLSLTTQRFVPTDIEQPLTRRNLINLAHFLPKQPKDFDLHLIETFNKVVNLILHDHADPVNPFKQLEDPT